MHIILGLLGAIVTILVLLKRLDDVGIDLGWLNPFAWRRRAFRDRLETNPIYAVDVPLDAAGLMLLAVAKRDGELTGLEKATILDLYQEELQLSRKDANALLGTSAHLLHNAGTLTYNLEKVLKPSSEHFSKEQARSTIEMMEQIARTDGTASTEQLALINEARAVLLSRWEAKGKWS